MKTKLLLAALACVLGGPCTSKLRAEQKKPEEAKPKTAEIKLLVAEGNLKAAKRAIETAEKDREEGVRGANSGAAPNRWVSFFDTADRKLDEKGVILRVRVEGKKEKADAVVKLRGGDAPAVSKGLEEESDWVGPEEARDRKQSFSLEWENPPYATAKAAVEGTARVEEVLTADQRKFAEACLGSPKFPWSELRRYGVIEVWKSKIDFEGQSKVTVELWKLTRPDKTSAPLELLEVSIKTKGDIASQAEAAQKFYAAAEKFGLGRASGVSKTQAVLKFYEPGK